MRRAASSRPTSGASGRRSGLSAETFTDRFTRASAPWESCSSAGRSGHAGRRLGERVERLAAARRVAVGLGLGDGGLAQQVERHRGAVLPEAADRAQGGGGRLADDEAVRHVPHSRRRGGAQRRPPRPAARHPHRGGHRRRVLVHLAQVVPEVAGEVVERAAGGRHVHEPEEGRAQLLVLRRQLHRALVEGAERVAASRRERGMDRATHALQLGLHRRKVPRGARGTPPGRFRQCRSSSSVRLLRYVGETDAVIWVETTGPCEVEVLGARERTFCVCGHHYALVHADGLSPGTRYEYEVRLDGEPAWPPAASDFPPSGFRTLPRRGAAADRVRLLPRGRAPRAALHAAQGRGRSRARDRRPANPGAADARATNRGVAGPAADARRPGVRRRGLARRPARSPSRVATPRSRRARVCSTTRSTRGCTTRAGPSR